MSTSDILFLALALAMDCFAISIASGVIMRKRHWRIILQMSILFGTFQALMPLAGWLGTNHFSQHLEAIDHWIAFSLLLILGGRMIKQTFGPEEEVHFSPRKLSAQLLLSLATSIDALAVGISFACLGYRSINQLTSPLAVIGLVSFLMGVIGNLLGIHFGRSIEKKLRPELLGGVILIFIGCKILLTHMNLI